MLRAVLRQHRIRRCYPASSLFNSSSSSSSISRCISSLPDNADPPDPPSDIWAKLKEMGCHAYDMSKNTVWPSLQHLSETTPSLLPVSVSIASCAAGWMVLPRVLRRVHRYVEQGPTARLVGRTEEHPYHLTVWAAMEDPTRLFVTLIAFSQLAAWVAPTTIAENYLSQIWNGGLVGSGLWFLYRWKNIAFSRVLSRKAITKDEQDWYMNLNKLSSLGVVIIGTMSLAEISGVAVQSVLTVGGVGGVAAAFAARDILGNALSGFLLQFFKPFTVGDVITSGNIEGKVIEIGLHSTSLLNTDKFFVHVPNSLFLNQAITNKSRSSKQMLYSKFYVTKTDVEKLSDIASQVVELMKAHPMVKADGEPPLCHISMEPLNIKISLACEVHPMKQHDAHKVEKDILIKAASIFQKSGAVLSGLQ